MVVWGSRLFGRIYTYNGMFVAVNCLHVWYFPLVPVRAYFVLEARGRQWRGVPIPLGSRYALQAIGVAYLRGFLTVAMGVAAIFALLNYSDASRIHQESLPSVIVLIVAAIVCGLALVLSREFFVGSRDKLFEIAEHMGIHLNPAAIL